MPLSFYCYLYFINAIIILFIFQLYLTQVSICLFINISICLRINVKFYSSLNFRTYAKVLSTCSNSCSNHLYLLLLSLIISLLLLVSLLFTCKYLLIRFCISAFKANLSSFMLFCFLTAATDFFAKDILPCCDRRNKS